MNSNNLITVGPIVLALMLSLSGNAQSTPAPQVGCEGYWLTYTPPTIHGEVEPDCGVWEGGEVYPVAACPDEECTGCMWEGDVRYLVAPGARAVQTITWCHEVIDRLLTFDPDSWSLVWLIYEDQVLIGCDCRLTVRVEISNTTADPPCDFVFFEQTQSCECCPSHDY